MTHNFCEWVEMGMVFFRLHNRITLFYADGLDCFFVIHQRFKILFQYH